VTKRKQASCC